MRDEEVAVGGRRGSGDEVGAPTLGPWRTRLVPDLFPRAREELETIDARGLGAAVELVYQPGPARLGDRAVPRGERELVGLGATGREVVPRTLDLGETGIKAGWRAAVDAVLSSDLALATRLVLG